MWYYVEDQQQRGPVTDTDFETLRRDGKIHSETLVWRDGMADWKALREVQSGAASGSAPQTIAPVSSISDGRPVCVECGKSFQPDEVIRINDRWVCAACKPIFLQRISEGLFAGGRAATGLVSEAQVRERDYEHDIGGYFSQAWALFKSDMGILMGATVLVGLCLMVANCIPYLSVITGIVFTGPLLGGLFAFYLKKIRGQSASVGDAFSGFGPRFGQLLLGRFIPSLLAGLALVPVVLIAVIVMFSITIPQANHNGVHALSLGVPMVVLGTLVLAGLCVMVYLQYCWIFTLWLVADKNMSFWPAMSVSRAVVRKHWWWTFLLGVVTGLLVLLGMLLCLVGALFTAPVALGMWAYAYEKLFGDLQPA